ncbi:PREDICTED: uncharacterized protein LOC104594015 [Nelumbo nucifera]|uniref:Uncharacterized protein LOC104594015 n=1 Tax=Nelumbo nucifera TaxID=4432 RepID=A0A1U7ZFF2_NELNU|nr:PREDICTED: uncharacterized protein LOC104594015 [Nelumbo nucifera]
MVDFTVVRCPSSYNAILGRPTLNALQAAVSTFHLAMKFPKYGIGVARGDQKTTWQCYLLSCQGPRLAAKTLMIEAYDFRDEVRTKRGQPVEDLIQVPLNEGDPERIVQVGSLLNDHIRKKLVQLLRDHADVFAWSTTDMSGIDPEVLTHHLNADPRYRPVEQRKRSFATEWWLVIADEVQKLLDIDFIREVKYPDWLNKTRPTPKDNFPLPRIDQLIDAKASHELLSFMDAFSGYNQIRMHPDDQEKTAFITDRGLYCYKVMPFGLKNIGATDQ